jgi:hypothetical protein
MRFEGVINRTRHVKRESESMAWRDDRGALDGGGRLEAVKGFRRLKATRICPSSSPPLALAINDSASS